jgi:fatty-acyl-CoA synthase
LLISAKDAYRGETVKALIVLKEEFRQTTLEKDISDWAQGEMTTYKAPKRIEFVQSLPKSGSGKFLWRELQDLESQKNPLKRLSQVPSSS